MSPWSSEIEKIGPSFGILSNSTHSRSVFPTIKTEISPVHKLTDIDLSAVQEAKQTNNLLLDPKDLYHSGFGPSDWDNVWEKQGGSMVNGVP